MNEKYRLSGEELKAVSEEDCGPEDEWAVNRRVADAATAKVLKVLAEIPNEELRESIAEVVLEIRTYLNSTEFAPAPFRTPPDIGMLKETFPNKILSLIQAHTGAQPDEELKKKIIAVFDLARQEGMLHSKDGKHSRCSEGDANEVISFIQPYYQFRIEAARLEERNRAITIIRDLLKASQSDPDSIPQKLALIMKSWEKLPRATKWVEPAILTGYPKLPDQDKPITKAYLDNMARGMNRNGNQG